MTGTCLSLPTWPSGAVSVPNGRIERWICVKETGGGWDEQVYTACAQFYHCHQTRCCIITPPGEPIDVCSGIVWTFVDMNCSLCLLQVFMFYLHVMCISLLHIATYHCSFTCCIGSHCASSFRWVRFEVMSQQKEHTILRHYNAALQGGAQSLIEFFI